MPRTKSCRLCLLLLFVASAMVKGSGEQRHSTFPTPPAPAVSNPPASQQTKYSRRPLDTVAIERDAKELSALASSIPGDIDQIKKNLLPSDTLDKLKRIEKLSKQLRSQIQR